MLVFAVPSASWALPFDAVKPASSSPQGGASQASTKLRSKGAEKLQEYNTPSAFDASMFAAPSDMGFGNAPTVDGALRALGFAPRR